MTREIKILIRRDTAVNWEAQNPALNQGELGLDVTNKRVKVGDGFTSWNQLQFIEDEGLELIRTEYGTDIDFIIQLELNK